MSERRKRTIEEQREYQRLLAQKYRDELKEKYGTTYTTAQKSYILNYNAKVKKLSGKLPSSRNPFRIRAYKQTHEDNHIGLS